MAFSCRCNTWIVNCGRDDFIELQDSKLRNKYVCAVHFEDNAFTNANKNKLLSNHPKAVPKPWFEIDNHEVPVELDNSASISASNSVSIEDTISRPQETLDEFNDCFKPIEDRPVMHTDEQALTNNLILTPRKKKLLNSLTKHRALLKRTKSKITFLCRSTGKRQQSLKELLEVLPMFLLGDSLTFVKMQLRHLRRSAWTEEEKNFALSIYYKSPSAYRFLRDRGFKIPCVTLIRKWVSIYNVTPGFSTDVIAKLTKKVASMSDDEKQCVLLFDEMSIRKALEYEPKHDLIEGFEDLGPLGRTNNVASHALLFMLRGLKYHWKCPFSYVVAKNGVKSSSLALLLDLCVEKVFETGLSIRVIVCDQGSTNASAIRLMGVTDERPYLFYGKHKIHFVFDVPHLMKCIRNNFMNHDIEFNGMVVSWNDIRTFYDIDKGSKTGCRAAPKLSERHINPQNFQKMSVKLATQVFSASVSRGMQAACSTGMMKSPTGPNTAMFLGRLNDIFDCLNSKYCFDSNPLRKPLSTQNLKVMQCLKDALPFVKCWKLRSGRPNPPCFNGLVLGINSVLSLYNSLISEKNTTYLLTGRLNQDPIENIFGVLRQRGGYNANPSAKQFRCGLQHVMSIRLMDPPGLSNCEPDCDINLDIQQQEDKLSQVISQQQVKNYVQQLGGQEPQTDVAGKPHTHFILFIISYFCFSTV